MMGYSQQINPRSIQQRGRGKKEKMSLSQHYIRANADRQDSLNLTDALSELVMELRPQFHYFLIESCLDSFLKQKN